MFGFFKRLRLVEQDAEALLGETQKQQAQPRAQDEYIKAQDEKIEWIIGHLKEQDEKIDKLQKKLLEQEEKIGELSKRTISQATMGEDDPVSFNQIIDEWQNGEEGDELGS